MRTFSSLLRGLYDIKCRIKPQSAQKATLPTIFLPGELVEFGNTEEIFTKPKDKRTEDYISGRFE